MFTEAAGSTALPSVNSRPNSSLQLLREFHRAVLAAFDSDLLMATSLGEDGDDQHAKTSVLSVQRAAGDLVLHAMQSLSPSEVGIGAGGHPRADSPSPKPACSCSSRTTAKHPKPCCPSVACWKKFGPLVFLIWHVDMATDRLRQRPPSSLAFSYADMMPLRLLCS